MRLWPELVDAEPGGSATVALSLLGPCSVAALALFTRLETSTHFRSGFRRFADTDDEEEADEGKRELSAGSKSVEEAVFPSAKRYLMPYPGQSSPFLAHLLHFGSVRSHTILLFVQ